VVVHYKSSNGLTKKEYDDAIMKRIFENMIMDMDPTDLIPEQRKQLHIDYEELGDGTAEESNLTSRN